MYFQNYLQRPLTCSGRLMSTFVTLHKRKSDGKDLDKSSELDLPTVEDEQS